MKRKMILFLSLAILLTSIDFTYAAAPIYDDVVSGINNITDITEDTLKELTEYVVNGFKDVNIKDWFLPTVAKLVGLGGIDGYDDGTFRPKNTIAKAEYIKIVIGSLGFREEEPIDKHWATNYMSKAEEIGLTYKGEYQLNDYDVPITRNEAVKMAVRACEYLGENVPANYEEYKDYIKDYNSIPAEYRDYILKGTAIGLIDGYDDSTFRGNDNLTRAEGATIIVRIFDKTERVDIRDKAKGNNDDDFIEPKFYIKMYPDSSTNYFSIVLENYKDYLDKDYTFKTECISHPELNTRWVKSIFADGYYKYDFTQYVESSDLDEPTMMGMVYLFYLNDEYHKNPETKEPYELKDGEIMTFRVTISNGKKTKTYEVEAEFRKK